MHLNCLPAAQLPPASSPSSLSPLGQPLPTHSEAARAIITPSHRLMGPQFLPPPDGVTGGPERKPALLKVTASQQAKVKTLEKMLDWCIKEPIEQFGSIGYNNNKCVYPEDHQFHYPKSTLEKFWGKGIVTFSYYVILGSSPTIKKEELEDVYVKI